jgi:3-(3-hydroxy-phenyl)propionate hydroxylase
VWPLLEALGITPDDVEIHQHAFYKHHVRMSDTWRKGRVFLAGDAAHLMPPWAGAGMQTGMRDAHDLGWKLARVIKGELPASWLDTYEQERRPDAAFYTNLAVELGQVIKQEVTGLEPALNAPPTLVADWLRGRPRASLPT